MATTAADVAAPADRRGAIKLKPPPGGAKRWMALLFLFPALLLLGAIVVYPTIDTFAQSFQSSDRTWVGFDNYKDLLDTGRVRQAIQNNAIWVATAPAIITGLGLMFAILTERVRYQTAIKIIVFMPMAISFLATGVIWRLMYEEQPSRGLLNAVAKAGADVVSGPGAYPTATTVPDAPVTKQGGAVAAEGEFAGGDTALLPLVGMTEEELPEGAVQAVEPELSGDAVGAVVWRDFKPGGGEIGVIEQGELGLPGATVEAVDASGEVVATSESGDDGTVVFDDLSGNGPYSLRVAATTFAPGFQGISWLSPSLVTPAIIGAFSWMWTGFAVVVIAAGLAALPRDVLEAARVDGANEWQTFRHVTLPLLAPVLGVVFVTLVINVLKIFDIILVTAPGASQDEANVIALEMWKTSFTSGNFGLGSAVAVVLFLMVIPVMALNIRRFKRGE
ncbi:MAG TPA: ABC transporter permease subunit [Actinomycetota bacterium]|nr:ABC transporter permease subunit [Actinomycetota bacterium]